MPHLLAAISAHGFGHAMQTCLVLNALSRRMDDLRLTLRTTVSRKLLASRLNVPHELQPVADDFGMIMHSAVEVDVSASAAAYAAFHTDWPRRVAELARRLERDPPDLILSDVPYLTLAAGQQLGIPTAALCSLNWADIYRHYCRKQPESPGIHREILQAYQNAHCFLRPTPSMPMPDLDNTLEIAPLAERGVAQAQALRQRLGVSPQTRLILVALGGMDLPLPVNDWSPRPDLFWLLPGVWNIRREDCAAWEDLGLNFLDLLCSVDILLGKPGYGTFTEASRHGVPMIYLERVDWPESSWLESWLHEHNRALKINREQLNSGEFISRIEPLLAEPAPRVPQCDGAEQAADKLFSLL